MVKEIKYIANDGKSFDSKEECKAYEELPRLYYIWDDTSRLISRYVNHQEEISRTKFFLTHEDALEYLIKQRTSKNCDGWTRVHSVILDNSPMLSMEEFMIKSVEESEAITNNIANRASNLEKIIKFIKRII